MGNCFGRCLTSGKNSLRHSTDEQEADELVQEDETKEDNFIFKIIKFKKKKNRPQFIEKFWEQKESNYKRLNVQDKPIECSEIQLQCLDANNLLINNSTAKTAHDLPTTTTTTTTMKFNQQNLNNNNNSSQYDHQNSYHHENCYKNQIFNTDNNINCCNNSNYYYNNVNSSRASSSLDLEWEHEYNTSNNIHERRIINVNNDEIQNLNTQSWYFIPSDEEIITLKNNKCKKYNISNQQLLLNDDYNDVDDNDDDDDDEDAIDIVNCKNTKKFIKFNNSTNNLLDIKNNFYIKNSNKCNISVTSTPSSINFDSSTCINNYNIQYNNKNISSQCQYNIQQQQMQQQQQQPVTFIRTPSRTSWSHISTPESLEWDIDEEQQKQLRVEDDNLDHETLELLHEIELLKNKVLNETGSGLIDDKFEMNWKNDSS